MTNIELPVSIGEALDKHTILILKNKYIQNNDKSKEIQKELEVLSLKLEKYIKEFKYQYNCLLQINEEIWLDQDKFRITTNKDQNFDLCKKIIEDNDRRFRVKNKLNILYNSNLKEQKSYKQKTAVIFHHLGLGDHFTMNGAVRLLSTYYDNTIVVCKKIYENNVKDMYSDDFSITLYTIDSDFESTFTKNVKTIFKEYDLFLIGVHKKINNHINKILWSKKNIPTPYFFNSFYQDLYLDFKDRKKYEYINRDYKKEYNLYNHISSFNENYIFLHDTASNLNLNLLKDYLLNNDILVFNPNRNFYKDNINHKYYNVWENTFTDLINYSTVIEKAKELHLIDSAFYCLACCLNLPKNQIRKVYSRQEISAENFHKNYDGGLFNM